jgi:hypothetical protein
LDRNVAFCKIYFRFTISTDSEKPVWQIPTTTPWIDNISNLFDGLAAYSTEFVTQADLGDKSSPNPLTTSPINSEYIVYCVLGLIVVFILLFAAFVAAYIYKQCKRYNLNKNKPRTSIMNERQYQGFETQIEIPHVSHNEVEANISYLLPTHQEHGPYEDVAFLEINSEDEHNVNEENAYLSPIKEVSNIYAEYISDTNQV